MSEGVDTFAGISPGFPFGVSGTGSIRTTEGDETIRGKIIQTLFTAPGERVNLPDFGCGLFNMVFEPNNPVLAASMEFAVARALHRWMSDEIIAETVDVRTEEAMVVVEIVYIKKRDLVREELTVRFR